MPAAGLQDPPDHAREAVGAPACGCKGRSPSISPADTNLLHSHMEIVKQWNIGFYAAWFLKPVVLLGVGWRGQARRRTTIYTKLLLRRLLSREHLHSVRDSYTETRLREIGIENVINTACPTMWSLMPEHCGRSRRKKATTLL